MTAEEMRFVVSQILASPVIACQRDTMPTNYVHNSDDVLMNGGHAVCD
jgi:hypothetical protein